jgi:hypothetical protein
MGGYIGFGMAKHAPQRIDALVIGGQHPFARNQEGLRQVMREGISGGGEAFIAAFEKTEGAASDAYAARLRTADYEALLAMVQDRAGMEDMLGTMAMPCCVMRVTPIQCIRRRDWRASGLQTRVSSRCRVLLMQTFYQSRKVVPPVVEFLDAGG